MGYHMGEGSYLWNPWLIYDSYFSNQSNASICRHFTWAPLLFCFRSLFCGTARNRHPVGANGLLCLSPSLWQMAGGRWGPVPLTTQAVACCDVWVTEWQTVACSVCLCVSHSLSISANLFFALMSLFLVFLTIRVYLTCPPIRAAFTFSTLLSCVSFQTFFFLPRQNL